MQFYGEQRFEHSLQQVELVPRQLLSSPLCLLRLDFLPTTQPSNDWCSFEQMSAWERCPILLLFVLRTEARATSPR